MSRAARALCLCFGSFLLLCTAASAQSPLPQGLTCGLSYAEQKCLFLVGCGPTAPIDNACNGTHTVTIVFSDGDFRHTYPAADGYANVFDGDFGNSGGFGYRHQELTTGGVMDLAKSKDFILPQGTACGFHHTWNSPGSTCMGLDPAQAFATNPPTPERGCPSGWTPRRAADANSGGHYWVWCEYEDPNHFSARGFATSVLGLACGISHNNPTGEDRGPVCQGYRPLENLCPDSTTRAGWIDQGRSDGVGLGFCTTHDYVMRHPALSRGSLETTSTSTGTFTGWAYDPNAPESPIFVDLYIDGQAGSGAPGFRVAANAPRPDVRDSFHIRGDHGYSFTLPAQYLGARHTVYAYGISLFGQGNPLLNQSPGTYAPPPPPPPPPPLCRTCSIQ
jgi:hypothetical protein